MNGVGGKEKGRGRRRIRTWKEERNGMAGGEEGRGRRRRRRIGLIITIITTASSLYPLIRVISPIPPRSNQIRLKGACTGIQIRELETHLKTHRYRERGKFRLPFSSGREFRFTQGGDMLWVLRIKGYIRHPTSFTEP